MIILVMKSNKGSVSLKNSKTKKFSVLLLTLCFSIVISFNLSKSVSAAESVNHPIGTVGIANNYPIIMVHGLFGWGSDELYGINYWGGAESLKQILTSKGYTIYTPTIGSVSSNWDRACELYAYIKGGTVDYGEAHAKKYGHNRYGRTYPGVYQQFGTLDRSGQIQKIHLIGHSMGGQTVRVLAQLLENGDTDEISNTPSDNISPLFTGGHHWIDSITTIATPHDGSQESHEQEGIEPMAHDFFAAMAVQGGLVNSDNPCFDFRLDQWGLKKEPYESYQSYYKRVVSSNIWKETKDLSVWDLAPEGAKELNSWVKAQSDIYYFSLACEDTHKSLFTAYQVPNLNMNPLLLKSSYLIGAYTNNKPGDVPINSTWWQNDGIVSVVSATYPKVGSDDKMVQYSGTPQKGVWNYLGEIQDIDHIEVVGLSHPDTRKYLENKYIDLAKTLTNLPK